MVICRISIWNLSAAGKIAVALENNFWQIQKKIAFYYWNPFSYLHPSLILLTYVYLLEGWKLWGWSPDRDIFLVHFFQPKDFLPVLNLDGNVSNFSPSNLCGSIRNGWGNGWWFENRSCGIRNPRRISSGKSGWMPNRMDIWEYQTSQNFLDYFLCYEEDNWIQAGTPGAQK